MALFDPDIWELRALLRRDKAIARGRNYAEAHAGWCNDTIATKALRTTISWCASKGLAVIFERREKGMFDAENKLIRLSGRLRPERQLFLLLHECGHFLIGDKKKRERFGMGYSRAGDKRIMKTFHHRCDVLDEEFEAWQRGFKLSKRLKLKINKDRYDAIRTMLLKTYIGWALHPDEWMTLSSKEITDKIVA